MTDELKELLKLLTTMNNDEMTAFREECQRRLAEL